MLALTLCVIFLWLAGRKYLRFTLALLIMVFSIVLTFGLLGVQQTTTAVIHATGPDGYYLGYRIRAHPHSPDTVLLPPWFQDRIQFNSIYMMRSQ